MLTVGGRLNASQAGSLHRALLEAFEGAGRVVVAFRDVSEADLTLLQLLCAAQRTAVARGVLLRIDNPQTADTVRRLISAAGAQRCAGCTAGCPWSNVTDTGDEAGSGPGEE